MPFRPRISQQVVDRFKENIAGGKWPVGEKIPSENVLAGELGVSRVSIRMAIQQFLALNLMRSEHGRGTFLINDDLGAFSGGGNRVSAQECSDIAKVLEFRLILEPEGCFLAAKRADAGVIGALAAHLRLLVANVGKPEEFVQSDMAFHLEISQASGNPLLHKSLLDVFNQTRRDHARINKIFGYQNGARYHALIHRAFEKDNPKLARRLMAEHLRQGLEQLGKFQ
ncbi:MAG: FCD domain-containing protein [Planctomycetota bacterium]|nr:FCD domain-containing protein [Planctomycetota bacterium]